MRNGLSGKALIDSCNKDLGVCRNRRASRHAVVGRLGGILGTALFTALLSLVLAPSVRADTQTRISEFEYSATTGLLTKEVVKLHPADTVVIETSYAHDRFGNREKTTVTDPTMPSASRESSVTYDTQGRFQTTATNAANHTETRVYDGRFGVPTKLTGPNQLDTEWTYDSFGRKTEEKRTDSTATIQTYMYCDGVAGGMEVCPANGAYVLSSYVVGGLATPTGSHTKIYYDALEREIRREEQGYDGVGVRLIYVDTEYNSLGRVARVSEPYFVNDTPAWTVNSYDVLGRLVGQTLPDNSTITNAFDGLEGRSTNDKLQTRIETKNARGNVVKVEDADSKVTTYTYDAFDNLTTVTDPALNVTTTVFDNLGRRERLIDPDLGTIKYTYNAFGEILTEEDQKGQKTEYTYDVLGRMTERVDKDDMGSPVNTATWVYDTATGPGTGKLSTVSDDNGYQRSYTYNTDGRILTTAVTIENVSQGEFQYGYDIGGRLHTVKYPTAPATGPLDLTVEYLYNECGHLIQLNRVVDGNPNTLIWQALELDARDQVVVEKFGNQVESTRAYNNRGWLTGINTLSQGASSNDVQQLTYVYDSIGNVEVREDHITGLKEEFEYDVLNRLTRAEVTSSAPSIVQTVTYDAIGNILTKSDVGTYTYGFGGVGPHAVTSIAGTLNSNFTYDANGNMTAGNNRTVDWTTFDKPELIQRATETLHFTYGTERQRITQAVNVDAGGTAEKEIFYVSVDDTGHLEKTVHSTGAVDHQVYVYASGALVAALSQKEQINPPPQDSTFSEVTRYYHGDNLGSVSVITDENGNVVERLSYDAWGERRHHATGVNDQGITSETNRGYTKHEHLRTVGLVHMNGRVYDAQIGRFLSADPHVKNLFKTQSLNRYSYVLNNPLAYTDPSGFFWKKVLKFFKRVVKAVAFGIFSLKPVQKLLRRNKLLGTAIIVAASFINPGAAIAASAGVGYANGGLEGAIIGAASAAITYGIGSAIPGEGIGAIAGRALAHSVTQGSFAVAQGGEFGPAALAAGFSVFVGGFADATFDFGTSASFVSHAVIGGTASVIGGGKFLNGAATAAFVWALNKNLHPDVSRAQETDRQFNSAIDIWDFDASDVADLTYKVFVDGAGGFLVPAARLGKIAKWTMVRGPGNPKALGQNPFFGKTRDEIIGMFQRKGYIPKGPNPSAGVGHYMNPRTKRKYHLDLNHEPPKGPHVGVKRVRKGRFSRSRDYQTSD